MTVQEVDYAAMRQMKVVMSDDLYNIRKPMRILALTKQYYDAETAARKGNRYYYEVILGDPNGRGTLAVAPEQIRAEDREAFENLISAYRKRLEAEKRKSDL